MHKLSSIQRLYLHGVLLALVAPGAYVAAYLLRFDGVLDAEFSSLLARTVGAVAVVKIGIYSYFGLHRSWSRYVGFHDLVQIGKAVTSSTAGIILMDALFYSTTTLPRSVLLLDWGVSFVAICALRAAPRLVRSALRRVQAGPAGTRVLIVGVNDAGETLLRTLSTHSPLGYNVIGFLDDRSWLVGRRIGGVPVLGTTQQLEHFAHLHQIEEILLPAGSLPGKAVRQLLETSEHHSFRVKVLPTYEQLLEEKVSIQPRAVAIDDLLRRDSVELDVEAIRHWLDGSVILVTGSAGSIGSEICRQLLKVKLARLVVVDRSETAQFFLERELQRLAPHIAIDTVIADLNDAPRMRAVFEQYKPQVVFHAAAYKHVPLMEVHPGEAIKNIALATRTLVDLAEDFDTQAFVMISSDKAVNPTSVMGSCKQLAERYVQAKSATSPCRFVTVRFGNVLDSAGSVVPIFREQIARGGPVTVTHPEMTRYFMMIPEAAGLVIQAGAMGEGGEIFVLDMGEPVKIVDLARDMIRLSGLREGRDIEIEFTGMRPGEKLFEELYGEREAHLPTRHVKIKVAASQSWNLLRVISDLNHLESIANGPAETTHRELATIVPLYQTPVEYLKRAA